MQVSLIILAAMILVAGVVDSKADNIVISNDVLSVEDIVVEEDVPEPSSEPQAEDASDAPDQGDPFVYPGAGIVEENGESLVLDSSDDPKTITDWYKEAITEMGFSVRNFITTSSNGKVLNKLTGGSGSMMVEIQIESGSSSGNTTITVKSSLN